MASELFKLMGEISVESDGALKAIDNVLKAAQGLYNYINNNKGTIHVKDDTATSTINKVLREIEELRKKIDSEKGTINVDNTTALSVIGGVSTAITNMYSLINTNSGVINVDTSTASEKIEQLKLEAQSVAGYLGGTTANVTDNAGVAGAIGKITFFDDTEWDAKLAKLAEIGKKGLKYTEMATGALAAVGVYKSIGQVTDFFQTGFEFNQNMEKWTASFKTYLGGDLEEAIALVERLKQFAVDTPLSLEETMNQAVKLLATGTAPDELISVLTMLGDLSQGNSEIFSRVSTAYWQAMSAGALKAQDANQMAQAGIPIWQIMTDYYNAIGRDGFYEWTVGMTREIPSQASLPNSTVDPISAAEMNAALYMAVSKNGDYYNAMNNLMDTEYGKAQKMQDAYAQTAGAVTKAFFDVFSSDTINSLNASLDKLYTWANTNPEGLEKLASAFSTFATEGVETLTSALMQLVDFYGKHSQEINALLSIFGTILAVSGYPKLGLGMIMMGQSGTAANAQTDWEKDINGEGEFSLSDRLLSQESKDILASGGTRYDLSAEQQKMYELGETMYGTINQLEGALKLVFGESYELKQSDGLLTYLFDQVLPESMGYVGSFFENGMDGLSNALEDPTAKIDTKSLWNMLVEAFSFKKKEAPDDTNESYGPPTPEWFNPDLEGDTSSSLNRLKENMHNLGMLFASTGGMPYRGSRDSGDTSFADRSSTLSELYGETGGAVSIAGLIASVQGLAAAVQNMAGEIPSAISAGVGNISVTGTITTGNVTLDGGVVAGVLAPTLDLRLGDTNRIAYRRG